MHSHKHQEHLAGMALLDTQLAEVMEKVLARGLTPPKMISEPADEFDFFQMSEIKF